MTDLGKGLHTMQKKYIMKKKMYINKENTKYGQKKKEKEKVYGLTPPLFVDE